MTILVARHRKNDNSLCTQSRTPCEDYPHRWIQFGGNHGPGNQIDDLGLWWPGEGTHVRMLAALSVAGISSTVNRPRFATSPCRHQYHRFETRGDTTTKAQKHSFLWSTVKTRTVSQKVRARTHAQQLCPSFFLSSPPAMCTRTPIFLQCQRSLGHHACL